MSTFPNPTTPQSSLGSLGKSLLKMFPPIIQSQPHIQGRYQPDPQQVALQARDRDRAKQKADADSAAAQGLAAQAKVKDLDGHKATGDGSGLITIRRDPSTPWVNVVIGLVDSCNKSSKNARSKLGNTSYHALGGGKKRTVGRMINVVTQDIEEDDDESLLADESADNSNPSGDPSSDAA